MQKRIERKLTLSIEEVRDAILDNFAAKDMPHPAKYETAKIKLSKAGAILEWAEGDNV